MVYVGKEKHEYQIISGINHFNTTLASAVKDGWLPWGELQMQVVQPVGQHAYTKYAILLERITPEEENDSSAKD